MNRRKEIEQRLAVIKAELETRGAEMNAEEIKALEDEVTALQEERAAIDAAAERRTALLDRLAAGTTDENGNAPTVLRSFGAMDGSQNAEQRAETEDKYGTVAYRKAFMEYVVRDKQLPAEYRADALTKTTDVGAVIPTTVLNQIIQKLETAGNILALVTRTAYRGGVTIPKSTAKPVATWVAEGAGSDKQKMDTSGSVTFAYHKLRCAVAVSLEVDTMSMSAFESLLINNIVEAMTKALDAAIIKGTGSGQPTGILAAANITAATQAEQVVETSKLKYSDLCDAEGALPEAYEGGAIWCMSKKTFMSFIGMTDEQGQPIARVNYGLNGKPERVLLGRPVECTEHMPNFAAISTASGSTDSPYFGFLFNFKDYVLNTNYAMGVKKYEDNDTDDQITKGIMLADGKAVDVNSLVLLKKVASA